MGGGTEGLPPEYIIDRRLEELGIDTGRMDYQEKVYRLIQKRCDMRAEKC